MGLVVVSVESFGKPIMKEVSMDLMTHPLSTQESSSVKYTGMLVRGGLRSAKHTEPLLTVME